jgi:HD superfamily phosphohydrolase
MAAVIAQEGPYPLCHAHEVLASLLVESNSVREYLEELSAQYDVEFMPDRIARWILGNAEVGQQDRLYCAQVINGPFDADKLDYIFRDAHYSGLPLGMDLERLWSSCKVERDSARKTRILTLHQSSATPLEQILFNKINLFTVVYQHPKVRAAESMFQGVIEYIRANGARRMCGRKLESATDYLWMTDDRFFGEALRRRPDNPLHGMIHDILYRRLFVRALTISNDTVQGPPSAYQQLRQLNQSDASAYDERRQLAREIWEEADRPHSSHHIWLDLPADPPVREADKIFVRTASGGLTKLTFPLNYWASLYATHKWHGHVFCPPDCQQDVYDASKVVLRRRFGIEFKKSAGESSHVERP